MSDFVVKVENLTVDPVCYRDKPYMKYHNSYAVAQPSKLKNIPGKNQLSDLLHSLMILEI